MRLFSTLIGVLFIVTSCQDKQGLQIENQQLTEKTTLPCPSHDCTEVIFDIPIVIAPKNEIADSINTRILETVNTLVSFDEKEHTLSYKDIAHSFIQSYETIKLDFPQEGSSWTAKVNGKVIRQKPKMLSISLEHYVFSGGAHGYKGYQSFNFDPTTGHRYTNNELFKTITPFSELVEQKLRKTLSIPEGAPINSTGLMFENDTFKLPENIFFHEDKIIAYYNIYEIASYADGPISLEFSYEEVAPYLNAVD